MPALPISPKRKRPTKEPHTGPFPSRLKTSHLSPTHTLPDAQLRTDIKNPSSPRTTVAGRLQTLDLDANPELTPLAFSHSNLPCGENGVHAFTAATTSVTLPRREKEAEVLEVPETPRLKPVLLDEEREGGGVEMEAGLEKLWWSEGEITGHDPDPKDPADDGEGINGVGFLPVSLYFSSLENRENRVPRKFGKNNIFLPGRSDC